MPSSARESISPTWDKCLPPWPSPISPKFGCSLDPQNSQIWSDLGCNSAWPSLASGSVSHSIQAQLHHEQLPFVHDPLAGRAPEYLIELCHSVTDIPARRNLRSSSQVQLLVPRYRKERSGKRGFSPSPHHSCGTCFLPISDFSTTNINFFGRDSNSLLCNSPCYATEDLCQQCELYYVLLLLIWSRHILHGVIIQRDIRALRQRTMFVKIPNTSVWCTTIIYIASAVSTHTRNKLRGSSICRLSIPFTLLRFLQTPGLVKNSADPLWFPRKSRPGEHETVRLPLKLKLATANPQPVQTQELLAMAITSICRIKLSVPVESSAD